MPFRRDQDIRCFLSPGMSLSVYNMNVLMNIRREALPTRFYFLYNDYLSYMTASYPTYENAPSTGGNAEG